MKKYYCVTTTFIGADRATGFYFSTLEKAKKFLATCDNGEISEIMLDCYRLPFECCVWADIEYWLPVYAVN